MFRSAIHQLVTGRVSLLLLAGLAGCTEEQFPNTATVEQGLVSPCPFNTTAWNTIDSEKEIIVRFRQVVEDPCRTTWSTAAGCVDSIRGKWTFGHLMAVMSGATGPANATPEVIAATPGARSFVATWLRNWLTPQTVGSDPAQVQPRLKIKDFLLKQWFTASNCPLTAALDPVTDCPNLDLTAAPFRLEAIVNRIDMSGFDYTTGGTGSGELRFVFGLYDRNGAIGSVLTQEAGTTRQTEVILEYKYPTTHNAQDWATRFHNLRTRSLSDTTPTLAQSADPNGFAKGLQDITDLVTEAQAVPQGRNNGSSIGQVRTLEQTFSTSTFNAAWEFRQFQFLPSCIGTACPLAEVPLPQTPPIAANPTNAFIQGRALNAAEQGVFDFIVNNQDFISRSLHVVQPAMLAGSLVFLPNDAQNIWAYPNPVDSPNADWNYLIRHNFSIATCNGCHYQETNNVGQSFHIKPRDAGQTSTLSPFLLTSTSSTDGGMSPSGYQAIYDPTDANYAFQYNEPWRRNCEIRRVLSGELLAFTTTTGHGFAVGPLAPPTRSVTDMTFGQTIPATNPLTHLVPGASHAYDFNGKGGSVVTITMSADPCGAPDTFLHLYGPKDANGSFGQEIRFQDDGFGACNLDSQIKSFTLPASGNYLIVATSFSQAGTGNYQLQLTCESATCVP